MSSTTRKTLSDCDILSGMDGIHETIELPLARQWRRVCVILAVGVLAGGILSDAPLGWSTGPEQQPEPATPYAVIATAGIAVLILIERQTWRFRLAPLGVEVGGFFMRRSWTWRDFEQAEAGHGQFRFPQLSLWRRYLSGLGFVEDADAVNVWKILVAYVPTPKRWTKPIRIRLGHIRLTLSDEGMRIRGLFRKQFLPWEDLDKAIVLQSALSERGFLRLKLVLRGRCFLIKNFGSYRIRDERPADSDVVDLLVAHVPRERLLFCAISGPSRSIEEARERKKNAISEKWSITVAVLGCAGMFFYPVCRFAYGILVSGKPSREDPLFSVMVALCALSLGISILFMLLAIAAWREWSRREREREKDLEVFLSGSEPGHPDEAGTGL